MIGSNSLQNCLPAFPPNVADVSSPARKSQTPFGALSIPQPYDRYFFYAVCCTKLFKKPSALCKEITFLGGEEIKKGGGWFNGTVQWFWIVTCKYVFIQQKLFDNVLNVSVKKKKKTMYINLWGKKECRLYMNLFVHKSTGFIYYLIVTKN